MPSETELDRTPLYVGVALAASFAVLAGLGFAIVFVLSQPIHPLVLVIASAAGLGLTAGFISRLPLRERGPLVRWLVALFGLCVGLVFLGWLSKGLLGLNLISQEQESLDWNGLGQIVLGGFSAWLAVRAWSVRPASKRPISRLSDAIRSVFHLRKGSTSFSGASLTTTTSVPNNLAPRKRPTRKSSAKKVRTSPHKKAPQPVVKKRVRRTRRRARSTIRLSEAVEHRCPYCLEIVEPDDARGVKICSICHTLHHADCWAVTGMCQVPHHHK